MLKTSACSTELHTVRDTQDNFPVFIWLGSPEESNGSSLFYLPVLLSHRGPPGFLQKREKDSGKPVFCNRLKRPHGGRAGSNLTTSHQEGRTESGALSLFPCLKACVMESILTHGFCFSFTSQITTFENHLPEGADIIPSLAVPMRKSSASSAVKTNIHR